VPIVYLSLFSVCLLRNHRKEKVATFHAFCLEPNGTIEFYRFRFIVNRSIYLRTYRNRKIYLSIVLIQSLCKSLILLFFLSIFIIQSKSMCQVEGLEEFLNPSDSDLSKPAEETLIGSPDIPRTACRTSTRRKPIQEEPKSTQPLTRTRRGTRGRTAEDIDQENKDVNVHTTPVVASGRRRAPAASARRNIETQMREDEEDGKNEAKGRSAVPSSRGRPPVASARRKLETQKEENSVQGVYSTRRSVRLLENKMAKLCMMKNGSAEPVNMDRDLFEEMANSSERSEVSVEVEKNIHGMCLGTIPGAIHYA
jgi:hypothetical protein